MIFTKYHYPFENLVISDKCKTLTQQKVVVQLFENLVISDKCKTTFFVFIYC